MEAWTEAQQDPQYLLRGDVSIFFNSIGTQFSMCLCLHAALLLSFYRSCIAELSIQILDVSGTPSRITYYQYGREIMFNNHFSVY